MIGDEGRIETSVAEYRDMLGEPVRTPEQDLDWARVERVLHAEGEWTRDGASRIAALAKDYGAFVLRNALALAIALRIEDGELGL